METTARELNHHTGRILAAAAGGETVTVLKNGVPYARITSAAASSLPAHPPGPIGEIALPALDLPDLTDEEMEETLKGMGGL